MEEDEALVIYNENKTFFDPNFFYLSGAKDGVYQNSMLIITKNDRFIVTGSVDSQAARRTGFELIESEGQESNAAVIREKLGQYRIIGLNLKGITGFRYGWLTRVIGNERIVDASEKISSARQEKSLRELNLMKEAAKIGLEAIETVAENVKPGETESHVFAKLMFQILNNGAEGIGAGPVVAFGSNSADPHHRPTGRKLKQGEIMLVDFGARYLGYCSDLTRTYHVGRTPENISEMYSVVFDANKTAASKIKEGVDGYEVDLAARNVVDMSKFSGKFIHGLGHGVGIEVHDHAAFSQNAHFVLKRNMVVTVEPGVYVPGIGGVRLEDELIVSEDGCLRITSCPWDMPEI